MSYNQALSSKELFLNLLKATNQTLNPKMDAVILNLTIRRFEQIGYEVGVKGLEIYIERFAGSGKFPTVSLILELGGQPQITSGDLPQLIANKITSALRAFGFHHPTECQNAMGELGRMTMERLGGFYGLDTYESPSFLQKDLEKTALLVVKQNPNHREIQTLIDEVSKKNGLLNAKKNEPNHINGVLLESRRLLEKQNNENEPCHIRQLRAKFNSSGLLSSR